MVHPPFPWTFFWFGTRHTQCCSFSSTFLVTQNALWRELLHTSFTITLLSIAHVCSQISGRVTLFLAICADAFLFASPQVVSILFGPRRIEMFFCTLNSCALHTSLVHPFTLGFVERSLFFMLRFFLPFCCRTLVTPEFPSAYIKMLYLLWLKKLPSQNSLATADQIARIYISVPERVTCSCTLCPNTDDVINAFFRNCAKFVSTGFQ